MRRRLLRIIFTHSFVTISSSFAQAAGGDLQAIGTELVFELADGRLLRRDALVGVKLIVADTHGEKTIQIDSVEEDTTATGGSIYLYGLSFHDPDRRIASNVCQPDVRGRRVGFPLPDEAGGFSLTCTSGAEGKCVLMGYRPWETRDDVPMRDLHRACVRMLRADYGGDGYSTTTDGTLIDVYDRFGIQKPDIGNQMAFEAAWGTDGAVCVARPRVEQNIALREIARRYPRLLGYLGAEVCNEVNAWENPTALIVNRSAATSAEGDENDRAWASP